MSNNLNTLNNELKLLLLNIDENNRDNIKNQINEFEKDCLKIANKVFNKYKVPIYMNIHDIDNNKINTKSAWEYWKNDKNIYSNLSDNYCRDIYNNGNYVYPVRNPDTGVVYLKNCDTYYNEDLKKLSNIEKDISLLIAKARNTILDADLTSNKNKENIKKEIDNKLKDFEEYQYKYIQLVKLIDNVNILLNDKRNNLDKNTKKFNNINNEFNINRDNENLYNEKYFDNKKYNNKIIFYVKIFIFIAWLLIFGLFSLININRIIY